MYKLTKRRADTCSPFFDLLHNTLFGKISQFILAIKKFVIPLHHQKAIWCDEFVAQQVEHNTFNVGVLGSSPSEFTRRLQRCSRLFYICYNNFAVNKILSTHFYGYGWILPNNQHKEMVSSEKNTNFAIKEKFLTFIEEIVYTK